MFLKIMWLYERIRFNLNPRVFGALSEEPEKLNERNCWLNIGGHKRILRTTWFYRSTQTIIPLKNIYFKGLFRLEMLNNLKYLPLLVLSNTFLFYMNPFNENVEAEICLKF